MDDQPSSSRRSSFAYIPQEIIIDILSRMPVKTLLRFKCVCKLWKSFISDAKFIKRHLDRMLSGDNNLLHHHLLFTSYDPLDPFLFTSDESIQLQAVSMHSLLDSTNGNSVVDPIRATAIDLQLDETKFEMVEPMGSCNGLVLLFIPTARILLLLNPSTRETKRMPNSGQKMGDKMFNKYGFGYDRVSNDYKVVEVCTHYPPSQSQGDQVWLYSLKANSWRKIQHHSPSHPPPSGLLLSQSPSLKLVGDKLFWSTLRTFVSFDLIEETIEEFPLPINVENFVASVGQYGILSGKLCMIISFHAHFEIWTMEKTGMKGSWSRLFILPFLKGEDDEYMAIEPLYLTENNEVVVKCEEEIAVYTNINGKPSRRVLYPSNVRSPQIYVGSLVSPDGFDERSM